MYYYHILLKIVHVCFSEPLYILFNMILKSACFRVLWKMSRLCPLFNSGDVNKINNYRPLSIINNFAKVLEISTAWFYL